MNLNFSPINWILNKRVNKLNYINLKNTLFRRNNVET